MLQVDEINPKSKRTVLSCSYIESLANNDSSSVCGAGVTRVVSGVVASVVLNLVTRRFLQTVDQWVR